MNAATLSADERLFEEMVSYRKNVTGVDNTLFISPRGMTRHAARIKVAIAPPDSINPQTSTASVRIVDGAVVKGSAIPSHLLRQVLDFIALNREVLLDYWDYHIDTEELRQRLRKIR